SQRAQSVLVTDGPFAETKEQVLGFYLVETETMDEAVEMAKRLPQGVAHMEVRAVRPGGPPPD
ncbi:MAG TPA: YciI family protein, partial [Devosiaceae bacterium]|nr:YciI family protein [Devosiaceae bacterium]